MFKNLSACGAALVLAALLTPSVAPVDAQEKKPEKLQAQPRGDLRTLIQNAVASKQARLVIPPGVYRVAPEANAGAIITIRQARDLEIVADGVTMLCTKRTRALQFEGCRNVTLRGLTLDYEPLTFTQGKVVAMAKDKGWLDIKIDAGYPHILFDRIVICDPKTRFHKYGIDHLWGTKASWAEPGTIRITRKDVGRGVDLGDPVALSGGQEVGNCHGITVENGCANVVFRNVTIHCAPGMGLVDSNNETGIQMLGCKIVPGPKPPGATEERLLTTSWDGIQCQAARVGARIEDTVIERCGDDSWSVPARDLKVIDKVVERAGSTLLLRAPDGTPSDGGLRPGDRLVYRGPNGPSTAAIQGVRVVQKEVEGKAVPLAEVTLRNEAQGELPVEAGGFVFNLDCNSRGFIYRNNRIYSHGRGALVKVSDGVIEGNTFRGGDKAVVVNPEMGAGGSDRLVIRGNTITETGHHQAMPWSEQAGAICLSSSAGGGKLRPAGVFNDILIEDNTFSRVKGLNLFISSARKVTVRNNRFLNTHGTDPGRHNGADYNIDPLAVIAVAQSEGVRFDGNTIEGMGPFAKRVVATGPGASDLTDVEGGVRVRSK